MEVGAARSLMDSGLRQARYGLWITRDADSAEPSGGFRGLGVGNLDSIAALAGAATLRMADAPALIHRPSLRLCAPRKSSV